MSFKKVVPANDGKVDYCSKKTDGTRYAENLVKTTFKKQDANGNLVMLTPPPMPNANKR